MFLNQLSEMEKELYLELCAHAVAADGEFSPEEMEAIALYCYEMMIPNHLPDTDEPLESVLDEINRISSKQVKNIIAFELILLLKHDGAFDKKEKSFINIVIEKLGLNEEKYNRLEGLVNLHIALSNELDKAINN